MTNKRACVRGALYCSDRPINQYTKQVKWLDEQACSGDTHERSYVLLYAC
jgi:hypothetical protein